MLHRSLIVAIALCSYYSPAWAVCGDGVLDIAEACDDGNTDAADGCSDVCAVEAGYVCRVPNQLCDALVCDAELIDDGSGNISAAARTNYVEIGNGPGGFFGTVVDVGAGYHPRPEYAATYRELGMVADPMATGWTSWLYQGNVCTDGCGSVNGTCEDGGLDSTATTCEWGSDCTDCGTRFLGGLCDTSCDADTGNDGTCEDGGAGSADSSCALGTDCGDCGVRTPGVLCDDTCGTVNGTCEDGGQGSSASTCTLGTDCTDCGTRYAAEVVKPRPHYNGDFFVPGSPEEGFAISVGTPLCDNTCDAGTPDGVCEDGGLGSTAATCTLGTDCGDCGTRIGTPTVYNNNRDAGTQITGAIGTATCFTEEFCGHDGGGVEITWSGTTAEGLEINQSARVVNGGAFVVVDVDIKNTSASPLSVMYMRNIDPDNNEPVTGDYTTRNEVLNQGGDGDGFVHVEARQWDGDNGTDVGGFSVGDNYWAPFTDSSISLVGAGDNARVTYGGFSNRSPEAIYYASGFTQTVGAPGFDDVAISIVYFFESIAADETVSARYAYVLEADASSAVQCATDVDECLLGTDDCDPDHGVCINLPGSFECVCEDGYSGDGQTCANVDECTLGLDDCDSNASCEDTDGSWNCTCADGYEGDGTTCGNVDECSTGVDNCDTNATCADTEGGFTCTCGDGFEGDGTACSDIDECEAGTDDCAGGETCTNEIGGYTCESGDGGGCGCSLARERTPNTALFGLLVLALIVLRRRRC